MQIKRILPTLVIMVFLESREGKRQKKQCNVFYELFPVKLEIKERKQSRQ